jgi:hypothetical protein
MEAAGMLEGVHRVQISNEQVSNYEENSSIF